MVHCRRNAPTLFPHRETTGRATPAPWLSLWESWRANSEPERAQAVAYLEKCGDCGWVPSQFRSPPTIEPGDPQRCGSTARVTDSSSPAGATRPLSHGLRRASSPIGGAKGGCAAGFPPTCPLRRRYFPIGEITGRIVSARQRGKFFGQNRFGPVR